MTLDTACSSSLVALHVACQALHDRDCDGAVVGGANIFLNPEMGLAMSRFGILAEDGQTKTFDADAHGYGRAEAINAVYVKRLSDALRDGDNIRGVIRSTSTNRSVPLQFVSSLCVFIILIRTVMVAHLL